MMRKALFRTSFALLLLFSLTASSLWAQSEAESSENVLVIQQNGNGNSIELHEGDRVNVGVKGQFKLERGNLEKIGDSSVTVKGKEIPLDRINIVETIKPKKRKTGGGIVLAAIGVEVLAVGAAVYAALLNDGNPNSNFNPFVALIIGAIGFYFLGIFMFIGSLIHAFARKRYYLNRRWRARIEKRLRKKLN